MINTFSKTITKENIHFACIDNREKREGRIYIILQNGQRLILPPNVTKVPALFLMKGDCRVIYGNNIYDFFKPKEEYIKKKTTEDNGEPLAFSSSEMFGMSDNYAYLDLTPDELGAKGSGGTRQMHQYALLKQINKIETPPEDYVPDKVGTIDMGKLEMERAKDIQFPEQINYKSG